jgi:glycosyltransferase involved in cell wall biosynthesis
MRINPYVIPHGIDAELWNYQANYPKSGYVLWNKNRNTDVCNPEAVVYLADYYPEVQFKTTYTNAERANIETFGSISHRDMKPLVENCTVYLSTVKETFGIGILEAMAAARPVLGWNYGGNCDLVQHGVNGYLAQPNNYDDLANGLDYCLTHAPQLGENSRELVKNFTWPKAVEMVAECYRQAVEW